MGVGEGEMGHSEEGQGRTDARPEPVCVHHDLHTYHTTLP